VEFAVSSFPERTFTGTVRHISPTLDPQSRAQTVEAEVPNPKFELKPGFFATARLLMSADEPSLFVPTTAVVRDGDVARVYVVRDGVAHEQIVSVDDELSGTIRVASGLKPGESVVANGSGMNDGVKVR
jgi:RND family efflux transporter MFP subunit